MESWRDFVNAPKILDMDAGQFWDEIFYTTDEILQTERGDSLKPLRDFKPSEHIVEFDYTYRYHWEPGGDNRGPFFWRMQGIKEWLRSDKKNIERVLRTIFAENWEHLDEQTKKLIRQHVDDYFLIASTTHHLKSKTGTSPWSMSYDKDAERWPAWGDKASQDRLTNPQYDLDHRDGPTRKLDIKYPYKPRAGVTYQDVQDRLKELDPLAVSLAKRDPSTTSLSIPEEYPKDC